MKKHDKICKYPNHVPSDIQKELNNIKGCDQPTLIIEDDQDDDDDSIPDFDPDDIPKSSP